MDASEEQKLFDSIQLSSIATVITNPNLPDNPIVAFNRAFMELTGYSKDEIVGRNCRFLAGPDTEDSYSAVLRDSVAQCRPAMVELLNYKSDGRTFRNAVMIAPIFDGDGAPAYFIGSQMDVGEGGNSPANARRLRAVEQVKRLTPRQAEVLRQMALGFRNKQIAAQLGVSEKTVKMHRASLLERLAAPSSADAVRIAVEAGL